MKIGEISKKLGVHIRTLMYWEKTKKLIPNRTLGGQRNYTEEHLRIALGEPKKEKNRKIILYARVSTKNQKEDLKNQIQYLKQFIRKEGIKFDLIIEDYGSGLNYKRKGFNELLKLVENNDIEKIIITHKDRFIRFGFDWFYEFCKLHGCEIIVLDNTEKDIHSELVEDLISIVHVFSCRLYGLRNYKRKTKLEKVIENEINKKS